MKQPATDAAIDRLPDQREYLSLGRNLLHHGSLCFVDPRFQQTIFAYRMPGYPAFVALCGGSVTAIRIAQCLLDLSTIIAVYWIARHLSGHAAAGLIAAAIMAVNPFYIYFSSLILSETLFAAILAWAVYFFTCRLYMYGILLLVLDCLVRPSGVLLAPVLAAVAVANPLSVGPYSLGTTIKRTIIAIVLTSALMFWTLQCWATRNHYQLDSWVWTTTNAGITAYDGFNPEANGASDQRFIADFPQVKSMNEVQRSQFFQAKAWHWATDHWADLPALSVRKVLRGWSPVPLSADFGKPMYRWISAIYAVPFDLLVLVGLFSARSSLSLTRQGKILLAVPVFVVTVEQILSVGSIRYRMPAEATLAVLAAVGAVSVVHAFRHSSFGFRH